GSSATGASRSFTSTATTPSGPATSGSSSTSRPSRSTRSSTAAVCTGGPPRYPVSSGAAFNERHMPTSRIRTMAPSAASASCPCGIAVLCMASVPPSGAVRPRGSRGLTGKGLWSGRRHRGARSDRGERPGPGNHHSVGEAGDRLHVQPDEVVGVALGLLAGGQLLPGVLHQATGLLLSRGQRVGRLEGDVLLAQLGADVVLGEVGVAGEHHADDEEEPGQNQP